MTKILLDAWTCLRSLIAGIRPVYRRGAFAWMTVALFSALMPSAASARPAGRVVVLVAGNISIRDLAVSELPNISRLLAEGSSGLMNVRTGRPNKLIEPVQRPGMEPGCLAMGAGAMAVGGAEVRRAANADQMIGHVSAGRIWSCRTGDKLFGSKVVHTEIALIQRANQASTYRARPGLLGSVLSSAGISCAAIGNSDIPGEPHAECAAVAMDSQGLVARGDVSSPALLRSDPCAPFGVRANFDYLLDQVDRALANCRFVVVDVGDTYRADRYAQYCTDAQAQALRQRAVARLDKIVGCIASKLDFSADTLILLSPSPRIFTDLAEERLTPVLVRGPGFPKGVLTSPSTRKKGLVTICDVAPTVLKALDVQSPPEVTGRAMHSVRCDRPSDFLLNLNLQASLQGQRQVLVRAASVLQSAVVVLATAGLLLGSAAVRRISSWAALFPAALTLGVLYAPVLYSGGLAGTAGVILFTTAALMTLFGRVLRTPMRAFACLCGLVVASIIADLIGSGRLVSSSIAGYGVLEGARYYGLGNELMGSLLGAGLVGTASALRNLSISRPWAVWALPLALAVIFFFVGWPGLGANAGGAMAAAAALAAVAFVLSGWKLSFRTAVLIAVIAILGTASLFAADFLRGSAAQSHIGKLVEAAAGGTLAGAAVVAQRKLALNMMLVSTSVWSKLLGLSAAASIAIYLLARRKHCSDLQMVSKIDRAALVGGAVGTGAAFIFNDSGVLAAAACAVVLWSYTVLWYRELTGALLSGK